MWINMKDINILRLSAIIAPLSVAYELFFNHSALLAGIAGLWLFTLLIWLFLKETEIEENED